MFEIELFYRTIEAEIRAAHASYLKSMKRVPLTQVLPVVDKLPVGEDWKKLGFIARARLKRTYRKQVRARRRAERATPITVDDRLLKGYNAGIECALDVLTREFTRYKKRLEKEEKEGFAP